MDELIGILDKHGNPTGRACLKSEAHLKGLFHPTVHVWFYTSKGEVLLQKRAKNKDTFPSLWDVSVAGHIGAGEDIMQAAIREVDEEIGLSVSAANLEAIGTFKSMHKHSEILIDNEFHHVSLCELKVPLSNLKRQKTEVEELKLFPLKDFKTKVEQNQLDGFVPHTKSYYIKILDAISGKLKA